MGERLSGGNVAIALLANTLATGAGLRASEIVYDREASSFAQAAPGDFDWDVLLDGVTLLHMSGITPALGPQSADIAVAAAEAATRLGVPISFDGNYRSKLWEARKETGAPVLRKLLEGTKLAFIDERDIALVLGETFADRNAAAAAGFKAFPKLQRIAATACLAGGGDSSNPRRRRSNSARSPRSAALRPG